MRKTDGSIELNKQRQGWCLLFIFFSVGLHACDKRERPTSHVCTVCGFQVCTLLLFCLSTCLCMPFSHQTMWFACVEVSQRLCIILTESVDVLAACRLRFGCFLLFWLFFFFFYHSSLPLTYIILREIEG